MNQQNSQIVASTKREYKITTKDLPLSCPMSNMRLWDSHPRVYLPIATLGRVHCPYCGAVYILEDKKP